MSNIWLSCCFPLNFCSFFLASGDGIECVGDCIKGDVNQFFSKAMKHVDNFLMGLVLNFIQTLKGVTQIFCCGGGMLMGNCYNLSFDDQMVDNSDNTIEKTKTDIAATDPCVNYYESSYLAYLRYLGINPNHNEFIRVIQLTARISRVNKNFNSFVREGVISNQNFGNFWLPPEILYHIFSFLFATNNNQGFNISCSYTATAINFFPNTMARYPNDEKRFLVLVVYQLFKKSCEQHQEKCKPEKHALFTFLRPNYPWCEHCDDRKTKFEKSVQNRQKDKEVSLFSKQSPLLPGGTNEKTQDQDDLSVIINVL